MTCHDRGSNPRLTSHKFEVFRAIHCIRAAACTVYAKDFKIYQSAGQINLKILSARQTIYQSENLHQTMEFLFSTNIAVVTAYKSISIITTVQYYYLFNHLFHYFALLLAEFSISVCQVYFHIFFTFLESPVLKVGCFLELGIRDVEIRPKEENLTRCMNIFAGSFWHFSSILH